MANLTLTIDDEALQRARMRALQLGTSVNQLVREYLESFAASKDRYRTATEELLRLARRVKKVSAAKQGGGRGWTREDLYDREVFRR